MLLLTTPILVGAVIMSHLRHAFRITAMHKNADHNLATNITPKPKKDSYLLHTQEEKKKTVSNQGGHLLTIC